MKIHLVLVFISLFLLPSAPCFCQNDLKFIGFDDTVHFINPHVDTISSLESIKAPFEIIDTLTIPSGFVLKISTGLSSNKYEIALKLNNSFLLFVVVGDQQCSKIAVERIIFKDSINNKLLVKYSYSNGISFGGTKNYHLSEIYEEGFEIWDLMKIERLAYFKTYDSQILSDARGVISTSCENLTPIIKQSSILFKMRNNCNDFGENLKAVVDNVQIIQYILTPDGLIKQQLK